MSVVDGLVADYLTRLERAAAGLPPDRRSELLEEIGEHIASASPADESEVRTLLDRLGEPEEIVAVAREDLPAPPPPYGGTGTGWDPPPMAPVPRSTTQELAAVIMLTAGSFVPVVGWLVGLVLLWTSSLWRVREKVLATLVVPLGPGGVLVLGALLPAVTGGTQVCSGAPVPAGAAPSTDGPFVEAQGYQCEVTGGVLPGWAGWVLLPVLLLAPVAVAVVLMRRARRRAQEQPALVPAYGAAPPASPWGALEVSAVLVLGLGGLLVPVVGTLVGLGLALASARWTRRDKLVAVALCAGPLLVPLGLGAVRALEGRILL